MTDGEIASVKPSRIRVATLNANQSARQAAQGMEVPKNKVEQFLAVNSLRPGAQLKAGQRIKLVKRN